MWDPVLHPTSHPSSGSLPTVRLRQGTYIGVVQESTALVPLALDVFFGLPFAASTAGANRLRRPEAPSASEKTFHADRPGVRPPQPLADGPPEGEEGEEGEDCLTADVFRPRGAHGPLPVFVSLYGGAYNTGCSRTGRHLASLVAHAPDPMVAVAFNYRLGALGFLPSALAAQHGILNLGLYDQQALFAWVRQNIAHFGGDPLRITLVGFSAGGHSISHHLLHYTDDTVPFQRAILESASATARQVYSATHPRTEADFTDFLTYAGVSPEPPDDLIAALRRLPLSEITSASFQLWRDRAPKLIYPFQPCIDPSDDILPDLPVHALTDGRGVHAVPLLIGFSSHEGANIFPTAPDSPAGFRSFFSTLIPGLSAADLDALEQLYPDPTADPASEFGSLSPMTAAGPRPPPGAGQQWRRLVAAYTHYAYVCPSLQIAHYAALTGTPVFVHEYAARSGKLAAAAHGDVVPATARDQAIFGPFPGLVATAEALLRAYSRFVTSPRGDPNYGAGADEIHWPAYVSPLERGADPSAGRILVFGAGNTERVVGEGAGQAGVPVSLRSLSVTEVERCRFWWDRVELSQGLGQKSATA